MPNRPRDNFKHIWEVRKVGSHELVYSGDDYAAWAKEQGLSKGNLSRTELAPTRKWHRPHHMGYYLVSRSAYDI